MSILKSVTVTSTAALFAALLGLSSAAAVAADATAPEEVAPAAAATAAPSADEAKDAAPVVENAAPAKAEPAADAAAGALKAGDLALGTVVVGADGKEVGTVNRVRSEATGAVAEIHVSTVGSGVIAVPGDKIASVGKSVTLSLTSEQVSKLPTVGSKEG